MVSPADRKDAVLYLEKAYAQSERRCCRVLRLNRGLYRRQPKKDEQAFLRMRIKEIAALRIRYGYRRIHVLLKREGWTINVKRVYRLYKIEGLNLRNSTRRKRAIKTGSNRTSRQRRPMNAGPWISYLASWLKTRDEEIERLSQLLLNAQWARFGQHSEKRTYAINRMT